MDGGSEHKQAHTNGDPNREYASLMTKMVSALDTSSERARMTVEELTANMLTFYMV